MMSARTERFGYVPSHLRAPSRRPGAVDRARPSSRSLMSGNRLVLLDTESSNVVGGMGSSRFDVAAPQRF